MKIKDLDRAIKLVNAIKDIDAQLIQLQTWRIAGVTAVFYPTDTISRSEIYQSHEISFRSSIELIDLEIASKEKIREDLNSELESL